MPGCILFTHDAESVAPDHRLDGGQRNIQIGKRQIPLGGEFASRARPSNIAAALGGIMCRFLAAIVDLHWLTVELTSNAIITVLKLSQ
jgi:hypothetical protein